MKVPNFERLYKMAITEFKAKEMEFDAEFDREEKRMRYYLTVIWGEGESESDRYRFEQVNSVEKFSEPIRFLVDYMIRSDLATWEHCDEVDEDGNYELLKKVNRSPENIGGIIEVDHGFFCELEIERFGSVEECLMTCDVRGVQDDERELLGFFTWLCLKDGAAR